ncbi:MAG TPA: Yip1 family protein [Terricaulis sp.]|nr:Yip1 family protein [Terricaulis sp.]HRP10696.1 Yip1 family protein [Terricaulis sp.]
MSEDDAEKPASSHRFSVENAKKQAEEALHKSEFILSRAYGLFKDPKAEWEQIRAEKTTIPAILVGYAAPLAAIPPICDILGRYVFGQRVGEAMERPAFVDAIVNGVVFWLVAVALVGLLGILINAVAAHFDADQDDLAAQKVAAYSLTPAFLSGVFSLWPPLWWLSLFALAAMVYLMYRGLPILMKAPEDRALGYAATVTIAVMVCGIVLLSLASCVT